MVAFGRSTTFRSQLKKTIDCSASFCLGFSVTFLDLYFEEHLQEHCPNPCFSDVSRTVRMNMRSYSKARISGLAATEHDQNQ